MRFISYKQVFPPQLIHLFDETIKIKPKKIEGGREGPFDRT